MFNASFEKLNFFFLNSQFENYIKTSCGWQALAIWKFQIINELIKVATI